jgi:hypothetical protein
MAIQSAEDFSLGTHGTNLFFEFDPIRAGVIADDPITPSDPRGIWIVAKEDRIWCRLFAKRDDAENDALSISATHGHWFAFEGEQITLAGAPLPPGKFEADLIDAEQQLLGVVLGLLWDVKRGRRKLGPSPLPPYLFFTEEFTSFD